MADRYWVGGTGSWSSTNTANWAASSGGASGASVPTAADNVIFDAGSDSGGIFTVTMANTPRVCNDITISGLDFTMTLAGVSIGLTVSGSLSFPATNFTRTYTGTTIFNATTTGKTITTNGVAFGGNVTLNGVGGAWTLGSAFTTSADFTILNGTFDTSSSGNYGVTAGSIQSTTGAGVRTINLNASTIILNVIGSATVINPLVGTLTFNAGTSLINITGTSYNLASTVTYYDVSFTAAASTDFTKSITGANTFRNLTFSTISSAGINNISITGSQTINGTLTVNGSDGNRRMFVRSNTIGTSVTLTCAAVATMTDVDFRDITIAGAHGTLSGTRLGDCGGNSNITFVAGKTVYWNLAAGGNWSANGWAPGSGGTPATTEFPLPQDTAIIENTGLNTSATITFNRSFNIGTLDTSTRTDAMTLASAAAPTFYGNFTYGSGVTPTGTNTYTFSNRSIKTLNSGGKTFTQLVAINAPGGGIQLLTNNLTLTSTQTTSLVGGTLDLNNLTLSTGIFSGNFSSVRSIAFGTTGSIVLTTTTAGSTALSFDTATNFTFTGTSNISTAMSVTRTFNFGNTAGATTSNRLNINLTSGASVPTFTGSFRQIDFTGSTCNPGNQNIICHGFTLASGGTYTSTDFTTVGTGTLTSNGDVIDTLTVNGTGITTTLQDALTTLTGSGVATCTLTQGTLDLNGFTLTTSILSSSTSNTRAIAFGTTGSIVLAASSGQTNLSMANATAFTFTGTSNISAAMSVTRTFNFGGTAGATASNRLNINLTSGASVPTFTGSFRQIDFTGSTSNVGAQTISCHGFTLASGGTYTSTDFTTVGTGTLTYTGKAIDILNINTAGITTTLADAGQNVTTTLTNGTLNLAGFTLTNTTSAATATGTKNLTFNGGTLVCSAASATAWNNAAPTNFTTTAGTGTGIISMTAATAKTFVGGGSTYNCTLNQGGAGTLTITGANTFNDITNTNATASQITFPASTTNTFSNFTLSGTSGNLISIRSSTPATQFTLSKSSGTVSVSFLDIQDSNATGGATWQSFTSNGNVNSGNNLGWDFGGVTYAVSVSETATGADAITLLLTRVGAVSETATGADTTASQLDAVGAISETATGADTTASQLTTSGAVSETATGADAFQGNIETTSAVSETATGADTTATALTRVGAVSETATGTDTTVSQLDAVAFIDEGPLFLQATATLPVGTSFTGSTIFDNTSAGGGLAVVANGTGTGSGGGFNAGGNYILFSGVNTRSVKTIPLNLTTCSTFNFSIIRGNGTNGGETPDANENIVVEYSTNGGGSYTTIATILNTAAITTFTTLSYSMPVGAKTASTIIRWRQATSTQSNFDQYGIRNFVFGETGGASAADTTATTLTRVGAVDETATGADTTATQLDAFGGINETATAADALTTQLDGVANVDEVVTAQDLPLGNIITTLQISEGATILDESLARLLWELINDNQLPGWQVVQNAQGTGWTVINTNTGTSWTDIDTF